MWRTLLGREQPDPVRVHRRHQDYQWVFGWRGRRFRALMPERTDQNLLRRGGRRQDGIFWHRQTFVQPPNVAPKLPICHAARKNDMSSTLTADDPVCYAPNGFFKPNAALFCLVDRIDTVPSAFISPTAPRHQTCPVSRS